MQRWATLEASYRTLQVNLAADIEKIIEDRAAAASHSDHIDQQLTTAQNQLDMLRLKVADQQRELDVFNYDDEEELSLTEKKLLLGARRKTEQQLAANRFAENELTVTVNRLTREIALNRKYEADITASLDEAGREAAKLTELIARVRRKRLDDLTTL
jgi:hypothetical protein